MNTIDEWRNQIHQGDARETLAEMPANSVDCVVTSPPYWGLRDYGIEDQIGIEHAPEEYAGSLASVFDEVQRVLKQTGSLWLNLGDTYAGGGGASGVPDDWESKSMDRGKDIYPDDPPAKHTDYPKKCKLLIPSRVALELIDRGWICRNDAVWRQTNAMPESVTDRLSTKYEDVYFFTLEPDYYSDFETIKEQGSDGSLKNPGDVIDCPTASFSDAHFATFPRDLIEPFIRATCPEDGVVLDPFAGAGTACLVAKDLGRDFVGIELNPEYVAMAQARVGMDVDQPELLDDDHTPLTAFADGGDDR